jgi:hypothetical protein
MFTTLSIIGYNMSEARMYGEIILEIAYTGGEEKTSPCLAISQPGCDYIVVIAIALIS